MKETPWFAQGARRLRKIGVADRAHAVACGMRQWENIHQETSSRKPRDSAFAVERFARCWARLPVD
jgi:hypothetical protein